jgi:hypothetical protein
MVAFRRDFPLSIPKVPNLSACCVAMILKMGILDHPGRKNRSNLKIRTEDALKI